MKTTMFKNKIVNIALLGGALGITLAAITPKTNLARAAVNPNTKVIEITAKKFEFTPSEITLKKGEPVILRLTSADRVHGFMSKPLKIDTDIPPDKTTDVAVTPDSAGGFTVICDHYCGTGHGNMKMKVTVVE
ncbi:cupredoxin domain-containing protein [Candidatus Binatus sp.]|jgi:cytochrome c oxidase subunit 2|uniref:cupredoxin domain-containing protein n=1 Tax=Candidatus Binatus sp. TaxID=2811406 RepID=UPI003BBC859E